MASSSASRRLDPDIELGINEINAHAKAQFSGSLQCCWDDCKRRILRSNRDFKPGDKLFSDQPLRMVQERLGCRLLSELRSLYEEPKRKRINLDPLWCWCALHCLTSAELPKKFPCNCPKVDAEVQRKLLLLHHEAGEPPSGKHQGGTSDDRMEDASIVAKLLVRHFKLSTDASRVERLIHIWAFNSWEFSQEPRGQCIYFFSSFMSHSCRPNAICYYAGTEYVLRCRREIKAGEEVCISYLSEDELLQPAPKRQHFLSKYHFACCCDRCKRGQIDRSRGLWCPLEKCPGGVVFAYTPSKPVEKASDCWRADEWDGAICQTCGQKVQLTDARFLAQSEKDMEERVGSGVQSLELRNVELSESEGEAYDESGENSGSDSTLLLGSTTPTSSLKDVPMDGTATPTAAVAAAAAAAAAKSSATTSTATSSLVTKWARWTTPTEEAQVCGFRSMKDIKAAQEEAKTLFKQHALADSVWVQLHNLLTEQDNYSEQLKHLQKLNAFRKQASADLGLSGAYAWSLEGLADCLCLLGEADSVKEARGKYGEALHQLRLIFGKDHMYVREVESKLRMICPSRTWASGCLKPLPSATRSGVITKISKEATGRRSNTKPKKSKRCKR